MISFSTAIRNALADPSAEAVWLITLADTNNTTKITSWAADVTIGSETWSSTPELISITPQKGCVINHGADLRSEILFHDPSLTYFTRYQSFSTREVECEGKVVFIRGGAFTVPFSLFSGAVQRVGSRSGTTSVSVGSRLDLNDRRPVLLTDQAQQKRGGNNDLTLYHLNKDVVVDWAADDE